MLHYYHHHHQAVAATSASSDLSLSESWSTCGGTGGSSYIINSNKYVRAQQQQSTASSAEALERMIVRLASENAVVIFSNTTCCMCHAVKSLLCGMGVNPTVYELDQLVDPTLAKHIERALLSLILANYQHPPTTTAGVALLPVVFIGGKLLGPMDRVMASHINGTLVPLLKQAGALWL